ncbi:MAG: hypothetical protein ACRCZ9_00790 [Fusobacteriaceae bacterium]
MILVFKKNNQEVLEIKSTTMETISIEKNVEFLNTVIRLRFLSLEDGYTKTTGVAFEEVDSYEIKTDAGTLLEKSKKIKVISITTKSDAVTETIKNETVSWILTTKEV